MSWLSAVLNFFTNPLADVIGGWNERKTLAAKNTQKLVEAEINCKVAKLEAAAKRYEIEATADQDYDMQVLRNRNNTLADELIIVIWFIVFLMHFVPVTQPHMAKGWAAMGYESGPAWWFEFGMIGILVSTLGLMRVLRLMLGRAREKQLNAPKEGASQSRVLSGDS